MTQQHTEARNHFP